jgi:PAS domain-containing protein
VETHFPIPSSCSILNAPTPYCLSASTKVALRMPSAEPHHPRLDLEDMESDKAPLFVIRTGELALEFEFIFYNEAFRKLHLRDQILAKDKAALLFRSWTQALCDFKPRYDFEGRVWEAEVAGRSGGWKIVRATESDMKEQDQKRPDQEAKQEEGMGSGRTPVFTRSRTQFIGELKRDNPGPFRDPSCTNLNARWETIQTMMEMSDVGVFEYNSEGTLLHANEAWYRLRCVPLHR